MEERLQKVLAQAGVASRRSCEELIKQGRVKVNGQVVTELGTKVNASVDQILVDNKSIAQEEHVYVLLNKPTGVITSMSDPEGRKTVRDLIKKIPQRVYPVGRLDFDTSGLLIMTNDGELANRLAHPSFEMDKVYRAWVKGMPTTESVLQLAKGIKLEDGMTSPGKARILERNAKKNRTLIELTIHEGRNRQVRRMCQAIGHPVITLQRIQVSFLTLGNLDLGTYRFLQKGEVERLRSELKKVRKKTNKRL
ncbi:pseudouridine synthase [Brevibacillus laterosporus]|uniref:pseudouridine synthase n=1 Tax=Brevibacillus laterosporus TaxID=1465 RepID=UPI000CE546F0|nr:pseudouridine synthase [Brevibacillus laterosporus]MBG9797480.1 RNA pseudouridine synthase [Brevibacillus laterosporus]MCR8936173.1 rRNA pseudouridine synthase [Brevibacillus laterosporus]MCZ0838812.1 pseudouridine synthase [Brevibacillus laterosporus]MCZ0844842.1 pseudouridine synthase [Brevibacillus laterosporus]MED1913047.1 pseudouridine synthase [Brevibacillus laterosporus]